MIKRLGGFANERKDQLVIDDVCAAAASGATLDVLFQSGSVILFPLLFLSSVPASDQIIMHTDVPSISTPPPFSRHFRVLKTDRNGSFQGHFPAARVRTANTSD